MNRIVSALAMTLTFSTASCYDLHSEYEDLEPEKTPASWKRPDLSSPKEVYDMGSRQEDRLEKTRPIAKTVDWLNVSTPQGARYLNGAIEVDKIFREDANNLYGVKIRLKNRTDETMNLEYRIEFHGRRGQPLFSRHTSWTSFMIQPYLFAEVSDACEIQGSVGFILHIRKVGSDDSGVDDLTRKDQKRIETPAATKGK